MTAHEVDRAIDALARVQHGAFAFTQVGAVGGTTDMVEHRLSRGRWLHLAPSVYALASHPATWRQRLMAAVLGERRAVIAGASAAALHGLTGFRPGSIEVVVPRGSNHRSSLAVVRERSDFRATTVDGVPVLTICDTLFSVAASAHASRLALAMDDALAGRSLSVEELQLRYDELRRGRRPGMRVMGRLIANRSGHERIPPATVLEGMLYRILDRPTMPGYRRQARVPWSPDQRVDALLLDARVVIESDGRQWHTRVADFERDRKRDREATLHGHHTLRYTYRDLAHDPDRVELEVREAARVAA
jgi:very-short-patch-repair endonuclease